MLFVNEEKVFSFDQIDVASFYLAYMQDSAVIPFVLPQSFGSARCLCPGATFAHQNN